jgi:group I intron endonuclease
VLIIYKATNLINGKVYIGQTIVSIAERMGDHRRKAFRHNSRSHFHSAIKKYGFNCFEWEIIDRAKTRDELNGKEVSWIEKSGSLDRLLGYNIDIGGGVYEIAESTKKKISKAHKGRKHTPEQNAAKSILMSGNGNNFYGRKHSDETKKRISASRKGKGLGQTDLQKEKCSRRGVENNRASIDDEKAMIIKALISQGVRDCTIIKKLGITKSIFRGIKCHRTWRHVPWPLDHISQN